MANSIVGAEGYMAPEIAFLVTLPPNWREHVRSFYVYTKAVDWWSLGCFYFI